MGAVAEKGEREAVAEASERPVWQQLNSKRACATIGGIMDPVRREMLVDSATTALRGIKATREKVKVMARKATGAVLRVQTLADKVIQQEERKDLLRQNSRRHLVICLSKGSVNKLLKAALAITRLR